MKGGRLSCDTYAFDAGDLGSRKLNMMGMKESEDERGFLNALFRGAFLPKED